VLEVYLNCTQISALLPPTLRNWMASVTIVVGLVGFVVVAVHVVVTAVDQAVLVTRFVTYHTLVPSLVTVMLSPGVQSPKLESEVFWKPALIVSEPEQVKLLAWVTSVAWVFVIVTTKPAPADAASGSVPVAPAALEQ